jgi:thymidylate synthase (FAD)
MTQNSIDPYFKVEVISRTPNPQQSIYAAMHQDYAEGFVWDELFETKEIFSLDTSEPNGRKWAGPSEQQCGDVIIKRLLAGGRGHFGCLEHPQIVFNCGWFPHSVAQQIRTHRVGISFDIQSGRYTGQRVLDVVNGVRDVEEVFYLRPPGKYADRQGDPYEYTQKRREFHLKRCLEAAEVYQEDLHEHGLSEEHARDLIPYGIRQHFVMSVNVRSLMHLLDLRAAKNAQLECRQLCELIFPHFEAWVPAIADYYLKNRYGKARLAP